MLALVAAPTAVAFAPCSDVFHPDFSRPGRDSSRGFVATTAAGGAVCRGWCRAGEVAGSS